MPSRWAEITDAGGTPQLPPIGQMAYLLPLSRRLGRLENNGFGIKPVPHSEVEAFQRMEGLTPQEGRALRLMSESYVEGINLGGDLFANPPWDGPDDI